MVVESIFGQVDGQSAVMEYDALNESLEVRTVAPLNVVARVSGPSVGSAIHLTGPEIGLVKTLDQLAGTSPVDHLATNGCNRRRAHRLGHALQPCN